MVTTIKLRTLLFLFHTFPVKVILAGKFFCLFRESCDILIVMKCNEYEEVVNKIMYSRRFGKAKGVDVSTEMLDLLGRPCKGMNIIHVAGTNGKGSTCNFIANGLTALGFKVGLFTSPHLIDFTERIRVNNRCIPKESVLSYAKKLFLLDLKLEPTMFDYCFAMALLYFRDEKCDFVVIETGLGGTFDSTNAMIKSPFATVITNISFDHTAILGDTLEEIASNKAGVIKNDTSLVIARMPEKARNVLLDKSKNVELHSLVDLNDKKMYKETDTFFEKYSSSEVSYILDTYQKENVYAAIATLNVIFEKKRDLVITNYMEFVKNSQDEACVNGCDGKCSECTTNDSLEDWFGKNIVNALNNTTWPGRFEVMGNVIIDGAHNPDGFRALKESLLRRYIGVDVSFNFVVGVLADKDFIKGLEYIKDISTKVYTVTIDDPRAKDGRELADELLELGYDSSFLGEEIDAAKLILENVNNSSENMSKELYNVYVFCGSLYFVGKVKGKLCQLQQE